MIVAGVRVPTNSAMYRAIADLKPEAQEQRVLDYKELLAQRQCWMDQVSERQRLSPVQNAYNPFDHEAACSLIAQAEALVPGITATRRGGWGVVTGYVHNSKKDWSPWLVEDIVEELIKVRNPEFYEERGVRTFADYVRWTQGDLLYDLAQASRSSDLTLRKKLVQKASRLAYTFKHFCKGVKGYDEVVAQIDIERKSPYHVQDHNLGTVMDPLITLYEEVVVPMLSKLSMHELAFLWVLSESCLVPDREVKMMPPVEWKVPASLGSALTLMLKDFPTKESWMANERYCVNPCSVKTDAKEYVYRLC